MLSEEGGARGAEELDAYAAEAVAQYRAQEAARRKRRQAEGIAAAKARGTRFGRPRVEAPDCFERIVQAWEGKELSMDTALRLCGMSETTFFRRVREYRNRN